MKKKKNSNNDTEQNKLRACSQRRYKVLKGTLKAFETATHLES
jgi:hypothetical protein